ncbi:MAG: DUF2877 domain-containing protein [Caldilineaceae bacterium]
MYQPSALQSGSVALRERAQGGIDALRAGYQHDDEVKIRDGVTRLAGLGPGLTPAGDDFLVGLLAALHGYRRPMQEDQTRFCQRIAQTAAPLTTQLSAHWLHHAGQGDFGEAWHQLIIALNSGATDAITTAAHRILTTGATSGVDAMNGFLFGISLLQETGD